MKKIIGLTCTEMPDIEHPAQRVNEDYIDAIYRSGAIPVLIPIGDQEAIDYLLTKLDGVLITGGIDINPLFYHQNCAFEQSVSSYRRDEFEWHLIKKCVQKHIPLFGICRGQQMINVVFGGTLYQDNKLFNEHVIQHQQKERKDYPIHAIQIEKDSFLYPIFKDQYYVNSLHHQSIAEIAKDFKVVARSEDQIIEAIEHISLPIWAVQFHPEMMHQRDERMQELFQWFIDQCQ